MIAQFIELPWLAPLAILLPLFTYWALRRERKSRAERLHRFGTKSAVFALAPVTTRRGLLRKISVGVAMLLLGVAIAGPRWGLGDSEVTSSGIDVVLAMDASLSMLAQDERPSRLKSMTQVAKQLYASSPNDRFALLAFAGKSYILSPLTMDPGALRLYLDNLDPSVVGQSGSSLASTIRQAVNLLSATKAISDRAVVVMTDGEGFDDREEVIAEATKAGKLGIEVITVGFGTEAGATIPIVENGVRSQKLDLDGDVVITRYSPQALREIAEAAGGVFISADVADKAGQIRSMLDQLKTSARKVATGRSLEPQFQWFVLAALVLLLIDLLASLRPRTRNSVVVKSIATVACITSLSACSILQDWKDRKQYNKGTELLLKDSVELAISTLDSVIDARNEDVRFRALFNSGYGYLVRDSLDSALVRYKEALRLSPDDFDAKWNYELALRPPQGGGGGGGGGDSDQSSGNDGAPQSSGNSESVPQPSGGVSQQRAGLILDNIEREERYVQNKRQQKNVPQPPPRGKDW